MNCPNCHEFIEPGAAFCGNCGYPVQPPAPAPPSAPPNVAQTGQVVQNEQPAIPANPPPTAAPLPAPSPTPAAASVPSYAVATPAQHAGETPALLAVIFGIIGIAGSALLIPVLGLIFGIAGLCMGTVSRRRSRRPLAIVGLIIAALAIVAGLGSLVWNLEHDKSASQNAQTGQSTEKSKVLSKLSTPCYSFNLIDAYNVSNNSGSCNTTIFNGQNFTDSTNIYKIVATKTDASDPGTFTTVAKQAIESDIQTNLPGFTITAQGPSSFAGSLAYTIYAADKSQDTVVVETGVLHQTSNGDNVFDILHAINGTNINLQSLETQWQWK
jgi:hypothetical protein